MYNFDTLIDRSQTGASKWVNRTDEEKRLNIVPMSVADMELPVAPCVKEAAVRAAEVGIYGYTEATDDYFSAVIGWMQRRHNLALAPEHIVPIAGVVPGISIAIRAFTEPGDGIIIQSPVYHPFRIATELNRRRVLSCPLIENDGRYEMDFDALEAAAKRPDAKLMILCSPHNPVGRVWTADELMRVCDICVRHGVLIISDEIHADLVRPGRHTAFATLPGAARNAAITLTAPSKTFNIPGLQNANAFIFDAGLRERFGLQAQVDGLDGLSYFGYAVSIAAYNGAWDWLTAVLDYVEGNYALLKGSLREMRPDARLFPLEGTYLAWIDLGCLGMGNSALQAFLREKAHLILNDGAMFGPEGECFVRLNLALPRPELKKALGRLADALSLLGSR